MASLLAELVQCRLMFLLTLVLGIGFTFQYGYHISSLTAPSKFIKSFINDTWQQRYNTTVGEENLTLIWSSTVSVYSLGGVLGGLLIGMFTRKYGKRRCNLYTNILMIGASLIMSFSKMAASFEMILIGRFLYGVTSGFGVNLCLQFLGEIAPLKFRGLINTSATVFVTVGRLFGQIVGLSEILGTENLWPLLLSLTGATSLLQLMVFSFFPDTPANLLIAKKDKEGCIKAMKKLWGESDHQVEIEELIKEQNRRTNTKSLTVLQLLRDKSLRPQLGIMVLLIGAMQLSGIYFYTYDIFLQAGSTPDLIPYISIGVGACELLGTIVCSTLIDKFGRKVLLLTGYGVMCTALGLLTVTLSFQDSYPWVPYCSVVLVFVYILFYGIGTAGVTITILIEVLSYSTRTSAFVIVNCLNWVGLYIIAMIFPYMVDSLQHFCFLIFLGCLIIAWILLFLLLPETKGKSLTEITEEFDRLRCRQTCCQAAEQEKQPEYIASTKV